MASSILVLAAFELLFVAPFIVTYTYVNIYVTGKGFLPAVCALLALSSLAYYAIASLLARGFTKVFGKPWLTLSAALLLAAVANSASLFCIVRVYGYGSASWESLSAVLSHSISLSNVYAFLAIGMDDLDPESLASYLTVNTVTLAIISWAAAAARLTRGPVKAASEVYAALRRATVAVALCVKPLEYLILALWTTILVIIALS